MTAQLIESNSYTVLDDVEDIFHGQIDTEIEIDEESEKEGKEDETEQEPIKFEFGDLIRVARNVSERLNGDYSVEDYYNPESAYVSSETYSWEHFKIEYYYNDYDYESLTGTEPDSEFDKKEHLGSTEDEFFGILNISEKFGEALNNSIEDNKVDVLDDIDEEQFFSNDFGAPTLVDRYDLEKSVPDDKKKHFEEIDRYWVSEPYAFISLFRSSKENEVKYYVIEPHLNELESQTRDFFVEKMENTLKYSGGEYDSDSEVSRATQIENEFNSLLERYDIKYHGGEEFFGYDDDGPRDFVYQPPNIFDSVGRTNRMLETDAIEIDSKKLTKRQLYSILYYIKRDFVGYEKIDPIKNDINVEDISCDGYNAPVFAYHSSHEQIISNVYHEKERLDEFVVKLAQRSGKGISKRQPQVDCTLPDGSRAQLTLGAEVSDHGTNYTIRQFKDVPFTPIDLINWKTFDLHEMAFLWLCIENHKSLIFAGGTASGKTTSLNAVSLFIPSNTKIVSIEDTREVELPQRNWIASVTRPSFNDDEKGDIDEFDLLEAALRQRPDYIVMGEIRGEEGRTAFQVMSTGHTTYTTFHADSVDEVLKRFTTDPINVSKTMFTALDLVSIQVSTRVNGNKVRRNKVLTEINEYDPENDEINVQDVYQWIAERDEFQYNRNANILNEIMFDRGWSNEQLQKELKMRQAVIAYLIENNINTYAQVAATFQAFMRDNETILALMKEDELENSLEDLREMESIHIDIDPEDEEMTPRPEPGEEELETSAEVLEEAAEMLWDDLPTLDEIDIETALKGGDEIEEVESELVDNNENEIEPEGVENE